MDLPSTEVNLKIRDLARISYASADPFLILFYLPYRSPLGQGNIFSFSPFFSLGGWGGKEVDT